MVSVRPSSYRCTREVAKLERSVRVARGDSRAKQKTKKPLTNRVCGPITAHVVPEIYDKCICYTYININNYLAGFTF